MQIIFEKPIAKETRGRGVSKTTLNSGRPESPRRRLKGSQAPHWKYEVRTKYNEKPTELDELTEEEIRR